MIYQVQFLPELKIQGFLETVMKKEKTKVVRAIILDEQGRVLLGKRAQGKGAGTWALIGGKPDGNETPEKTIIREVKEELGIEFDPHFYLEELDKESFPREFWDVRYFEGGFEGKISLNEENSEIMFVSLEDLDNFEIAFDHKELLIKFFKGKSKCFKKF